MTTNDTFGGSFQNQDFDTEFVTGPAGSSSPVSPQDRFVPHQPTSLGEASLNESLVHSLILKFLYVRGTFHGREVAEQLKLPFSVVEEQLYSLKNQLLIGYRGAAVGGDYQYELTPKGVEQARRFIEHCTYYGAAPVSVPDYVESIKRQSLKNLCPRFDQVAEALNDLIVNQSIISQVGQAIRAGKSLFLFGAPGNGKTSIASRLIRAVDEAIWIPRTLTVGGEVVRLYDPSVHEEVPLPREGGILKQQVVDERWVRIKRPTVVVGGELSLKHLETNLNPVTGVIESPVHLKSNCGCLVVDDFGRQRISTIELLNRWIVPLECGHDFLNMPSGRQLQVPFDQLVVFSTNLRPSDLCDEAFLRRIPYKVQVFDPTEVQFRQLFARQARQHGLNYEEELIDYLLENYYRKENRSMRFCHVDDLLCQVKEFCDFHERPPQLTRETVDIACNNYFSTI